MPLANLGPVEQLFTPDDIMGGRLPQAGVDHLEAGVAQRASDDLGTIGRSARIEITLPEREFLHQRLLDNGWNVKRTAERLGIPRQSLQKMIKRLELE